MEHYFVFLWIMWNKSEHMLYYMPMLGPLFKKWKDMKNIISQSRILYYFSSNNLEIWGCVTLSAHLKPWLTSRLFLAFDFMIFTVGKPYSQRCLLANGTGAVRALLQRIGYSKSDFLQKVGGQNLEQMAPMCYLIEHQGILLLSWHDFLPP
jgi:hypothetical protein